MASSERALGRIRVLDLGQHEAGSTCTQLLGWVGADIVKVEAPKTGDPGRRIGSPLQTQEPDPSGFDAWYFLMHNSNKRSVTLNLKDARGYEIFCELVKRADVVVENFAPGTLERMKLGYDVLSALNPGIVLARIKGYGLTGPHANFRSFDTISQAAGGIMALTGPKGGVPHRVGPSIADSSSGVMTAFGIVSALLQRTFTGRGQVVEISMQEVVMNLTRGRMSDYYKAEPHKAPERQGNSLVRGVPSGLFPSKGGGPNDYVYLISNAALLPNVNVWEILLRAMGRDDLIGDARYDTGAKRAERKAEVDAIFTEWSMQHTKYEITECLGAAGIICSAVMDIEDQMKDPHLDERGAMIEYDHPTRGRVRVPGSPVRLSDSSTETRRPPLLGEHTGEVLKELLDFDDARIEELRSAGVV